jgi:site-specific DNA-methyltransferase (cytosine-N4-specific)
MREPYWHDPTATLYLGDARSALAQMPIGSVDCIVTSPPAWTPHDDPPADQEGAGNLGHETTAALYVAAMRRVCAEAHRVLADDGTFWLILSDRYGAQTGWTAPSIGRHARRVVDPAMTGLPASSLIGLPWQIAFALHDDGWFIRNAIVWDHGDSGERTTDRLPLTYELIFLLTKQDRIDWQRRHSGSGTPECRPGNSRRRGTRHSGGRASGTYGNAAGRCRGGNDQAATAPPGGAPAHGNEPGDVWTLPGRSSWNSLPIELPLRCIIAGCRPGGTVLDPFAGIATTGIAARELGRSFIGIEANAALCELAKARLSHAGGNAAEGPE